jgi:hypothetical protein
MPEEQGGNPPIFFRKKDIAEILLKVALNTKNLKSINHLKKKSLLKCTIFSKLLQEAFNLANTEIKKKQYWR